MPLSRSTRTAWRYCSVRSVWAFCRLLACRSLLFQDEHSLRFLGGSSCSTFLTTWASFVQLMQPLQRCLERTTNCKHHLRSCRKWSGLPCHLPPSPAPPVTRSPCGFQNDHLLWKRKTRILNNSKPQKPQLIAIKPQWISILMAFISAMICHDVPQLILIFNTLGIETVESQKRTPNHWFRQVTHVCPAQFRIITSAWCSKRSLMTWSPQKCLSTHLVREKIYLPSIKHGNGKLWEFSSGYHIT